jgi:hypothetical protein
MMRECHASRQLVADCSFAVNDVLIGIIEGGHVEVRAAHEEEMRASLQAVFLR